MKKLIIIIFILFSCTQKESTESEKLDNSLMSKYTEFALKTDLTQLSENQKKMIPLLIEASKIMNELFWKQSYGEKDELLGKLEGDKKDFAMVNYGPWDRLESNASFVEGYANKLPQANLYPADMTKEEFEGADLADKSSLYTLLRRDDSGKLITVPYHEAFAEELKAASALLRKAAELADDADFKKYLELRADAFLTSEYYESDLAWMSMKKNKIDFVVGPIETYEDQLYGYKAAFEAYVLIKDMSWSERLQKYADFLPELQKGLPVDEKYKMEMPGANSELNAYDVIYYAGDCNAGSKTIAINLPNDERVQLKYGTRRLQLKNAMQAKFEKILIPIADELINPEQVKHIKFDAFFANTMFHEVAHGLGIKNTINDKGTVRKALKEQASALEEGKADVLGLYMIHQLQKKGEVALEMNDYYVTFMASIFRSVRFGGASAHGRANLLRFNYFKDMGAFSYDDSTMKYTVHFDKMEQAMNALSEVILTLQGDGNYDAVVELMKDKGVVGPELQRDLDRLASKGIPVDIVFDQGLGTLGL